jgi:hypothetical protein
LFGGFGYALGYYAGKEKAVRMGVQIEQSVNAYESKCLLNAIYKQMQTNNQGQGQGATGQPNPQHKMNDDLPNL